MISQVTGQVVAADLHHVVIDLHGLGVAVQATPGTLAKCRVGERTTLYTALVVREDSLTLFGFLTADERAVFGTLQTVSGVGPRLALAMLAVHSPEDLRLAVANEDHAALQRVPGVGKKGAQRIALELAGKIGEPHSDASSPNDVPPAATAAKSSVTEALTGLGWSVKQAEQAIDAVLTDGAPQDAAGLLRAALQALGNQS